MVRLIFAIVALAWGGAVLSAEKAAPATREAPAVDEAPAAREAPAANEEPLDVEAILQETPTAEDYGGMGRCLSRHNYQHVEMLGDRHMLFEGRRGVWLNRLRSRCLIRDDDILVIEHRSSSVCALDQVSGRSRGFVSMVHGSCRLGDFQEIDPQQALALKESIKLAKHNKRQQAKQQKREAKRQSQDAS